MRAKLGKLFALARRPRFVSALLRHGTAAAVEHLDVIAWSKARVLLDVGANKGQFSLAFRACKPEAQIIAFEPLDLAANTYGKVFAGDQRVTLHRVALASISLPHPAHRARFLFFSRHRQQRSSRRPIV